MNVKNLPPNDTVAASVERVLVIEHYQVITPFLLPLFANGSPTLVFVSIKGIVSNGPTAHLTLFGQTIFPETLACAEGFTLIAYFFKPYALQSIFGVSALELTNKPVDLNLLASKKTSELQERLLNTVSTESRIALMDQYILNLMSIATIDCSAIQYAADRIALNPSPEILTSVQKELHITERTFQRMFEKNIGIAPNLYRRVRQFNAAFQQLNNRGYQKLSDIAFQNGYADQSHFIRAFKEFTNLSPTDYLNFGK